jgi:predicted DNA-binding transcriptional regulator YafY
LGRVLHHGYWYLHAYCCQRKQRRLFRLDRASDFIVTERSFIPRRQSEPARFSWEERQATRAIVHIAAEEGLADELANRLGAAAQRAVSGGMLAQVPVHGTAYFVASVLALGGAATVLQPPALRAQVREAAEAAAAAHL